MPEFKKFHYELAQGNTPGQIAALLKMVAVSQVMYGTDYPFRDGAEVNPASRTRASPRPISQRSSATTRRKLLPRKAGKRQVCRRGLQPYPQSCVGSGSSPALAPPDDRLPRDRAPVRRQLLGAAQREREDGVGRVEAPRGRKDAGPGDVEVRQLVGLAVAVGHRVAGRRCP